MFFAVPRLLLLLLLLLQGLPQRILNYLLCTLDVSKLDAKNRFEGVNFRAPPHPARSRAKIIKRIVSIKRLFSTLPF
jgi:hypothetical protein